jgi:hypothetical protein
MIEYGKMGSIPTRTPVLELIKANIKDIDARHLLIISSSDAAISILDSYLRYVIS